VFFFKWAFLVVFFTTLVASLLHGATCRYIICVVPSFYLLVLGLFLIIFVSLIHFHAPFSSGEGGRSSSPRRTSNTSRPTAMSDSSAGTTQRWDQAWSDLWALHLVLGQPQGHFPLSVSSRTCLNKQFRDILDTWLNQRS